MEGGDVDFPNRVILDPTFKNSIELMCVYNKLTADNNPLFRETVGAFIEDPKFNLTFKIGNCNNTNDACTNTDDPYNISITIEDLGQDPIEFAQTILHEAIHAEMARFVALFESGVDVNDKPRLFELYKFYRENGVTEQDIDHPYMSMYYVNPITAALREFDNNSYPLDYYKFIAWDGLRIWDVNNVLNEPMEDIYDSYRPIVIQNSTICD